MKEFLAFAVRQLVDHPDQTEIKDEKQGAGHRYWLALPLPEVGKVIGKHGHTITAIRNLLSAAAARTNTISGHIRGVTNTIVSVEILEQASSR